MNRLRWTQVDNFQVDNLQVTLNRLRWTMLEEEIKRSDNRSVCLARGELWWRHGPINQVEVQVVEREVAMHLIIKYLKYQICTPTITFDTLVNKPGGETGG